MGRKINIRCQYYWVKAYSESGNGKKDGLYNLEHWISKVSDYNLVNLEKDINGVKGRLENCNKNEDFYALNFVKMGEYSSSYVVKQGEAARHVDISIENDEYIGSNTVALYDARTSIMVITGTRSGFSVNTIMNYINSFDDKPICYLEPIKSKADFFKEENRFGKIRIKISSVKDYVPTQGVIYEQALRAAEEMSAETYDFEFNVGRKKNTYLDANVVRAIISDALYNMGAVSIARVRMTDEKGTQMYDLFDNVVKSSLSLQTNDKGEIPYIQIAKAIQEKYQKSEYCVEDKDDVR